MFSREIPYTARGHCLPRFCRCRWGEKELDIVAGMQRLWDEERGVPSNGMEIVHRPMRTFQIQVVDDGSRVEERSDEELRLEDDEDGEQEEPLPPYTFRDESRWGLGDGEALPAFEAAAL
ncbi:MAG: hypothetical protein MMC33_005673 [Icmadophila ericetorum]|nr:hypothetical protein [Icmadophila ericetorum]